MQIERQPPLFLHLEMFLLHQEASHNTQRTIDYYAYNLTRFLGFLATVDVHSPQAITAHHIRMFLVDLERQDLSSSYVHGYARSIKTWCNFLVNEDTIPTSPMAKVKMPKLDEQILPPFEEDEVRLLLSACEGETATRDRAVILCLIDSGLRAAEFVALNVGDIDRDGIITTLGKGRKERYVRLSARSRKELLKYLSTRQASDGDPLWVGRKGRIGTDGLLHAMMRVGKRAGVWPVGIHRFRRTFAITAYRNGMDPLQLRQILGHNDLQTTLRYLKFEKEDMIKAHVKASPVDNWKL